MLKFLNKNSGSFLGVDIGTMGVKVVQLGGEKGSLKLETYGLLETYGSFELLNSSLQVKNSKLLSNRVSDLLKRVISESKATAKQVAMSVPIFSTFSSLIELPDMPDNEVAAAVSFEARRYIPIPLNEVILGWNIVGRRINKEAGDLGGGDSSKKIQILLVAISKEIAKRYAHIAELSGLKLTGLETESFSLARSLIGKEDVQNSEAVIIVDIGSRTTNVIIADKGLVIKNHSVNTSGDEITRAISYGLGVDFDRAESLKRNFGLNARDTSGKKVFEIIVPIVDMVLAEVEKTMDYYFRKRGRKIGKVILTGGSANLDGLGDYFSKKLELKALVGNPWRYLSYPRSLTPVLQEIAPTFSIAVGLAMKGVEDN